MKETKDKVQLENESLQVEDCGEQKEQNVTSTSEETDSEEMSESTLENQLAKAQAKIDELNDKYLRQVAEFDNYRKRVIKEKAELIKNGGEKVITNLLPVLDDFDRAKDVMNKADDVNAVKEGVNLIIDKLLKILKQEGLEKMDVVGSDFDTDYHEAIAMVPGQPDEMKGKVIDCVLSGYILNEKVVRHAKVAVAQ